MGWAEGWWFRTSCWFRISSLQAGIAVTIMLLACFSAWGLGCRVKGSGFRIQGSGCRVQGSGFRVQDAGSRAWGFDPEGDRCYHHVARLLRFEGLVRFGICVLCSARERRISFSPSLSISLSPSPSLPLSPPLSLSLTIFLSLSLCLYVALSFSVSHSLSPSHSSSRSRRGSLSPSCCSPASAFQGFGFGD